MSDHLRTTIVFPRQQNRVLLGMKKRGFGEGWWNGFGGKLENGESLEDNARREAEEEVGIKIADLHLVGRILFYFENKLEVVSGVFVTDDFTGEPRETEEMRPQWFETARLPFGQMWDADRLWIPQALQLVRGEPILSLAVMFDSQKKYESMREVEPAEMDGYFDPI